MSKKTLMCGLIVLAFVFAAGSALTSFGPAASGGQIEPGGRPAKIKSYFLEGSSGSYLVAPMVYGEHGFIVTDVAAHIGYGVNGPVTVVLTDGTEPQNKKTSLLFGEAVSNDFTFPASYHFESGIVFGPGVPLRVDINIGNSPNPPCSITISGYGL